MISNLKFQSSGVAGTISASVTGFHRLQDVLRCEDVPLADIAAALPAQWMQFTSFADCGHGAWRDQPEAGLARLRRFILD